MDKIYSEKDVTDLGLSWGEWKFSLSEDIIQERISSLCPRTEIIHPEEEGWARLFSITKESSNVNQTTIDENMTVTIIEETPMDHSTVGETDNDKIAENVPENVQDICSSLVDVCCRLVPKLRLGPSAVRVECESVINDSSKLNEETLISVMKNAWIQLQSDESKLCFSVVFASTSSMCHSLCKHILLPWLSVSHSSKLELLSSILSKEGDIVCVNLIAPLLQNENSPWVSDLPGVEEFMSAMTVQHWTTLLKELLSHVSELQEWQIPVLAVAVEKAEPSHQELHFLVQLMSSSSTHFLQNRDFGALVAAVASSLKSDTSSLGPQLKAIVNNFKGSLKVMKLKTLKIIADISD